MQGNFCSKAGGGRERGEEKGVGEEEEEKEKVEERGRKGEDLVVEGVSAFVCTVPLETRRSQARRPGTGLVNHNSAAANTKSSSIPANLDSWLGAALSGQFQPR